MFDVNSGLVGCTFASPVSSELNHFSKEQVTDDKYKYAYSAMSSSVTIGANTIVRRSH